MSSNSLTITIPDEIKGLYNWAKEYDPQFQGDDAAIVAFLLKLGAEKYYEDGLKNVEGFEGMG